MALPFFGKKSEQKNINLLPEEAVESAFVKSNILKALVIPLTVVGLLLVIFIGLTLLKLQESVSHNSLTAKISQKRQEWQKLSDVAAVVSKINNNLETYQREAENNKLIRNNLLNISATLPNSTTLTKIDLSLDGNGFIEGSSTSPRVAHQLLEELKRNAKFSRVELTKIIYQSTDRKFNFAITFQIKTL